MKIKFDQNLFQILWYDLKKLLWQDELNPRVRCAFGNVLMSQSQDWNSSFWQEDRDAHICSHCLFLCGLFSHPSATHPWSVLDACRWLFQDKEREKYLLSHHSIVPRDIQVSFFYFWSCLFLMILFVMMVIYWQRLYVFIGPESDHWLCLSLTHSLTDWLTHSCLVNLIDVTLACEDANSKVVNVVTVADEDRVGNNLLRIWKLRFCQKTKLLFRLQAQGMVKILKLKFRQDLQLEMASFFLLIFCRGYEVESWSRFWS